MANQNHIHADVRLDCKGLACPMPIVKTKKAIDVMDGGQVIEIAATDKGSLADLKAWSSGAGHQYLGTLTSGDVYRHYIRKASPGEAKPASAHIPVMSNVELQAKRSAGEDIIVVDVREEAEYAFGHVKGAIGIPLGQLAARVDELDRENDIFVVCRTGTRSEMACRLLAEKGFKRVRNVLPGMSEWDGEIESALEEGNAHDE